MKKINVDGFIFDLDGTIYLGDKALPTAVETIAELRRRGKRLLFASNKTVESRRSYAEKLAAFGIPTPVDDILSPATVLASYLSRNRLDLRLYVIGEKGFREELRSFGLQVVDEKWDQDPQQVIDPAGIDAVVVAGDRSLDYRKINTAYQALVRGARFFVANPDKTCPAPNGAVPDAGATIAALETISGRQVDVLAGKPSPLMLEAALDKLQLPANRCMMVGDVLETDIRMGQKAGMATALVLTGLTRREDLAQADDLPDYVLETLSELLEIVL